MSIGNSYIISSMIFLIIIGSVYFLKQKINNEENIIYSRLLIISIIGCIVAIPTYYLVKDSASYGVWAEIISKLYLLFLLSWTFYFSLYLLVLIKNEMKMADIIVKKSKIIYVLYFVTNVIVLILLKIDYFSKEGVVYTLGPAVNYTYAICGIHIAFWVITFIIKFRLLKNKKAIPMIVALLGGIIMAIVQKIDPSVRLMTPVIVIITAVMYFTIENPDVRLVEYEKREKELAVSANEAKSAFLSSMSHELRTPLNAIVGLSEDMLSYKDQVPNEVKEDCDDIVNASNTLLEIIGNILDISKIEGGKLELVESDYLPKEEIESLLKIMRTKVEEKDLKFNVFIDPNIPECLYGDRLRIKQIINNFLSNAIKYTEKGSIDFGARWVNNCLELKVRDTGRGIKPEDKDKLFEKFERLHVEKTSAVQGTGLGLAITKNLVDLMGGNIKVDSVFREGSTFDVVIPQKIGNKDNIVREALTVEEKHDIDFTGKKVLIVDDNKLNIKVLRKAISLYNFDIDECYNGEEALKKIKDNSYDLIFMDIMMPVMGGEETMGILKQDVNFNVPVLALTADATTGAKERYLSIGFVDYLAKPFSRDTIAKKLENVFKDTK